jgi:hypothetical protein
MSDHIKSIVVEGRSQMSKLIAEALKRKLTRRLHHHVSHSGQQSVNTTDEGCQVTEHDLGQLYDEIGQILSSE